MLFIPILASFLSESETTDLFLFLLLYILATKISTFLNKTYKYSFKGKLNVLKQKRLPVKRQPL